MVLNLLSTTAPPIPPANVEVNRTSDTVMIVGWDLLTPEQARGFITSYTVVFSKVLMDHTVSGI